MAAQNYQYGASGKFPGPPSTGGGAHDCFYKVGVIQYGFRAPSKGGLGLIYGRLGENPYKNYLAVSINWGSFGGWSKSCTTSQNPDDLPRGYIRAPPL